MTSIESELHPQSEDAATAPTAGADAPPLLQIKDLYKRYGSLEVLHGVSIEVERGQVVGLIGASGSGKSTLLRCVNFLEQPNSGDIILDGELIGYEKTPSGRRKLRDRDVCRQRSEMAMVFQHFGLWPHRTVLENVIEGLIVVRGKPRAEAVAIGEAMLEKVGLSAKLASYPRQLSGGQQQRVAIARALASRPKIMLLDEPTSALDPELVGDVLRSIQQVAAEGMTMVIVTHEMSFAHEVCDHVYFLENGSVADHGTAEYIFETSTNPRTQEFLKRYRRE